MPFEPIYREDLGRALHLAAIAGAEGGQRGYAREDARLRAAAGSRADAAAAADETADPPTMLGALAEGTSAESAWFARRWRLGEADAMSEHATRLARVANAFDEGGLLAGHAAELLASPAVGPRPVATPDPARVALHPRTDGSTAAVSAIAAMLRGAFRDHVGLSPDLIEELSWHCAVTAVLMARGQTEPDDALVASLAAASLPLPTQADAYAERLREIAPASLDQAPGEIGRIADGLAARRFQRLRRAWRRGFFVPRGFDLDAWVAQHRT